MARSLVVAPWGNFREWSGVEYRLGDVSTKSRSTLRSVLEYEGGSGEAYPVVLVPETLVSGDVLGRCRDPECYRRKVYGTVGKDASLFLEEMGVGENRVCVMPNIGDYSVAKWEIRGVDLNIVSYYSSMAMLCMLGVGLEKSVDRVVVDLSHGINFMVKAAYRAAMTSSRLLSAIMGREVEVVVYNSEPYRRGVETLEIHKVDGEVVTPGRAASRLVYSYYQGVHRLNSSVDVVKAVRIDRSHQMGREAKKRLNSDSHIKAVNKMLKIHGMQAAASVYFSLPLAALQVGANALRDVGSVEEAVSQLRGAITALQEAMPLVDILHGRVVRHYGGVDYDIVKSALAGAALTVYTMRLYRDFEGNGVYSSDGVVEAELDALEKVVERLPGPLQFVSIYEIHREKSPEREESGEGPAKYLSECCTGQNVQDRNFIAHAGLERNLACRRGSRVRYHESAASGGELYRVLEESLRKTMRLLFRGDQG
ncbi:CRISPR-associated DxTHG motif protein [Aeropyrum pernix]|uniref:CRISPR-associated DxTHG motif protein n=1 Tax=Aeropyrum pernix TaxID=56636 RepID=UPI0013F1671E|nr:CRISPR-associated DxTHG motif protein [Aeropyrum pernix]